MFSQVQVSNLSTSQLMLPPPGVQNLSLRITISPAKSTWEGKALLG